MIRFGPWSTALGFGALFGLAVAMALWGMRANATANRLLAALLLVIVLKLMPYVIGYAGFYDAYPWLSFAPFDLALSIGPLVYLYARRLTSGALPHGWYRHLLPALVQFTYYAIVFPFPVATKDLWNDAAHVPWVMPVVTVAELASMTIYLALAWQRHHAYQTWLVDHVSNREDYRLDWMRNFLVALSLMLLAWGMVSAANTLLHLDYFQRFPFYLALTVLVFYLGLEGWRHADRHYPLPVQAEAPPMVVSEGRDWIAQGEAWLARTHEAGWWRDPDLNLDRLARHLGTNTAYLSRALNEGLGLNFSEAIGRLRVAEVQRRLAEGDPGDLLQCAFGAGFSSKTSFNRVFKTQTGLTPSQYRESLRRPGAES